LKSVTLKQPSKRCWFPVHDHQFTTDLSLALPLVGRCVADIQRLEVKAFKSRRMSGWSLMLTITLPLQRRMKSANHLLPPCAVWASS
jgi:hypothetical protein